MLTLSDKRYIDTTVNTAIDKAVVHQAGLFKEYMADQMKEIKELMSLYPQREEVRSMIQEEINPLRLDIAALRRDFGDHESRICALENGRK